MGAIWSGGTQSHGTLWSTGELGTHSPPQANGMRISVLRVGTRHLNLHRESPGDEMARKYY